MGNSWTTYYTASIVSKAAIQQAKKRDEHIKLVYGRCGMLLDSWIQRNREKFHSAKRGVSTYGQPWTA
jgi:hypothetical protein